MSPSTLDLFQTLSGAQTPIQEVTGNLDEINLEEIVINMSNNEYLAKNSCSMNNEDIISDFGADTDTDYIPDSNSDSSDDDNIAVRSRQISVAAIVHSDDATNKGDLSTHRKDTNVRCTSEGSTVRTLLNETIECNIDENIEISNNDSNPEQIITSLGRPKKGRKRKHPDFTIAQAKTRKYANKCYLTKKKKLVEPKVFTDYSCSCQRQCYQLVSTEKRQHEFQKFVTLGSYEAQALYISRTVKENTKSRSYTVLKGNKSGKRKPREYTRIYSICGIDVCREMYINNFQVTTKKVDISLKKNRCGNILQDQRGKKGGGWNKTKDHEIEFITNIINKLPQYESHYRRDQNNDCKYLKLGMTVQTIYDLYLEEFKQINTDSEATEKPVSFSTLKRIFYNNFNLRCKSLKKDTCNKCDTLCIKIKNCANDVERRQYEEEKEAHLKRAEDLRRAMNEDMMRAKTDQSFECLTFDMEKTLPLPRIPTSVVFYKRQLWFYNCSVHTGSDNIGHCYVWVEGEAGRGSQEVGSCITNYIKNKLDPKVQHLALWSDCCGGQNRNIKIILMLKVVLNSHPTLKTITFKYLESGHTFLPNDTDFSKIETMLKYHERIYTVEEYINIIKRCKRKNPLQVYRMKKNDFMSTKNLEKNTVNRKLFITKEKVNWLKTKQILIDKENKFIIFMKTAMDAAFSQLNIEKKIKGKPIDISQHDLILLWPNGKEIPQAKLNDLMSMLDLIPRDCHVFYKSLKGNDNMVEDIDGYGELDFVPEETEY